MDRSEAQACLRILFVVALADGRVSPDEERALAILAGYGGDEAMPALLDVPAEVARIRSPAARRATFDAAVALATVDGRCSPEEHQLLEQLRVAFGIEDAPSVDSSEAAWREELREPLQRLAAEEVDFLHAIAKERDRLSEEAYAAMVEDLRARRARILEDALGPRALR